MGASADSAGPASADAPPPLPVIDDLWDFSDAAASEARFRAVLPRAEASGDAEYLATLLTQLARAEGMQARFADAHRTLDWAERAGRALAPGRPAARVLGLLERGRVHRSSKEAGKAAPLFREAFDAARAAGLDGSAVDAAHMVAIVETGAASDEWNERAVAIAEASEDPKARRWLGSLWNNLAWTRFAAKDYPGSMALQEKALAFFEGRGSAGAARTARWSIARVLRALGRTEDALARQRSVLAETERAGEEDGYVHEEIAECLTALAREPEARPHFRRAHALLSKDTFFVRDEAERFARLERLGREPAK